MQRSSKYADARRIKRIKQGVNLPTIRRIRLTLPQQRQEHSPGASTRNNSERKLLICGRDTQGKLRVEMEENAQMVWPETDRLYRDQDKVEPRPNLLSGRNDRKDE